MLSLNEKLHPSTHFAGDHDIKADGESFVERPIFSAVLHLKIFGKPMQRERRHEVGKGKWERMSNQPEVEPLGDGVLGERSIQSGEGVLGYTILNVSV